LLALACTNGPSREARISGDSLHVSTPSDSATLSATQGRDVAAAARLVDRLLDDVVPDTALWGSWAVYPLAQRIGIRVARLADGWWLLADTLVGYDGPKAQWRIRAALAVPAPRPGEQYVGSCMRTGATENDGTIAARVTLSTGEELKPIHGAFRLDPETWRLVPFPVDSLSCYNEGGG
jgi:hypothetical protein